MLFQKMTIQIGDNCFEICFNAEGGYQRRPNTYNENRLSAPFFTSIGGTHGKCMCTPHWFKDI